jgi:MSHA pilin protein MshD
MIRRCVKPRAGMALVEAAVSMVIISIMLVASLNAVGASRLGQRWNADRLRATSLASDLMAEICDKSYSDPNDPPLFGPEAGELLAGRSAFDDVDDYNGLSESPPKDRAGTAIAGLTGWTRAAAVAYVSPTDATVTSLTDTGVKRITVTVSRAGTPMAKLVALRTAAAPN